MAPQECVFCKIINGDIPSEKLYRDEKVVVVRDLRPKAPVHLLLLPVVHFSSPAELIEAMESVVGHLFIVAARLAAQEGVAESGYRLVVNVGPDGGQEVGHLHMHLMGGRRLEEMG
jgi:histidine triad (HIT) family protein